MENYEQLIQTEDLQKKIDNGYDLSIKNILNQTFTHFKQNVGMYVLLYLIILVLTILSAITIIGPLFVVWPLTIGFSYAALKADFDEKIEINDLFIGFKKFGPLVLYTFILMAIFAVIFIPFYFMMWQSGMMDPEAMLASGGELPAMFWWWYLFLYIFSLFVNAALVFAPFLIFYGNFSPMAAVKTSWDLAKQNFLKLALLIFILSLISFLGIVVFGIGILFSAPLAVVGYYILIKNVLFSKK